MRSLLLGWRMLPFIPKHRVPHPEAKLFEGQAAELQWRPFLTHKEQALSDHDAGVGREREPVVQYISIAEFQQRRNGQGLVELAWVEG
jgi:hypothetical protein